MIIIIWLRKMAIAKKIELAKGHVETLKQALYTEKIRIDNSRIFSMDRELMALGLQPRVRRTLKGHFGKVYALHWSGNGLKQSR